MTVFYSPGTGYFYDDRVSTFIPEDAHEFAAEERDALLAQVSNGRRLVCGPDGLPVLMDAFAQSPDELAEIERYWRSVQLTTTDGIVTRHRDEVEEGSPTTLTLEQYAELQAYRRLLRNWPEAGEFPLSEHRPSVPEWLSTLPQ
ncbi:phage tail protein [Pseudomonas sp. PS02303]|uniref:phage tail protein n=1 Tax=Pseudomonas sp. PS02303 TaxID=2991429 RepID=UPI002499D2BD|nr:phage tail protein [Pseudomonas sp. PS02303]